MHPWPADLAYATGRPVRQVAGPQLIEFQPGQGSKFVLLADSEWAEYQSWSDGWPKLIKVAEFEDEPGARQAVPDPDRRADRSRTPLQEELGRRLIVPAPSSFNRPNRGRPGRQLDGLGGLDAFFGRSR